MTACTIEACVDGSAGVEIRGRPRPSAYLIRRAVTMAPVPIRLVVLSKKDIRLMETQLAPDSLPLSVVEAVFDLPDLLLDFAREVLGLAFSRQVRIVNDLARLLFDFAFYLVELAFNPILCARPHLFFSCY
jgi:hypothetical protein